MPRVGGGWCGRQRPPHVHPTDPRRLQRDGAGVVVPAGAVVSDVVGSGVEVCVWDEFGCGVLVDGGNASTVVVRVAVVVMGTIPLVFFFLLVSFG